MKNNITLFLIMSFFTFNTSAQDLVFPSLSGFKVKTSYPVYVPDNLWNYLNGAADAYLSYDFQDLHVAQYKKGKQVIKLEIYRHADNVMAFGIYSSERSPSFRFMNLGAQGYIVGGAINFFKGNYYVKIRTFSDKEKILHSAESLALKVAELLEGESSMPAPLSQFPSDGKKSNEETYISENVLGHSFLNKAFKAVYQIGSDIFSIFIIQTSSSETATKIVNTYVASTGIDPVNSGEDRYMIRDGYNGTVFLAGKDNRIVIIAGLALDQSDIAEKYTSEILK